MTTDEVDRRKRLERHFYTVPVYAKRVVARTLRTDLVGWRYEVYNGWGHLLVEGRKIYKDAVAAIEAARQHSNEYAINLTRHKDDNMEGELR